MASINQDSVSARSRSRSSEDISDFLSEPASASEDSFVNLTDTPDYQYRCRLFEISQRFSKDDRKAITFIHKKHFPEKRKVPSGVKILEKLEEVGLFSQSNIRPLQDLLKRIDRSDIVNEFWPQNEESSQTESLPIIPDGNFPADAVLELHTSVPTGQEDQSFDPHRSLYVLGSVTSRSEWTDFFTHPTGALQPEVNKSDGKFESASEASIHDHENPAGADKLITSNSSPPMNDAKKLMETSIKSTARGEHTDSDTTVLAKSTTPSDTGSIQSTLSQSEKAFNTSKPQPGCIQLGLNRHEMGMCLVKHSKEKCIKHHTWYIHFAKSRSKIELRYELYPYGLGEDEGDYATLKLSAKPINMETLLPLYTYNVEFSVLVEAPQEIPAQLYQTNANVEISTGDPNPLYLRVLKHYEDIVKRTEDAFKLSIRAEYTHQQRPETVANDVTFKDREGEYTELDVKLNIPTQSQ